MMFASSFVVSARKRCISSAINARVMSSLMWCARRCCSSRLRDGGSTALINLEAADVKDATEKPDVDEDDDDDSEGGGEGFRSGEDSPATTRSRSIVICFTAVAWRSMYVMFSSSNSS